MSTDAQIARRWRGLLTIRTHLLTAARQRHEWRHNAATRAKLATRKAQVAYAQRVVARHSHPAPPHGVSTRGVALIAGYEGFVGHAYKPVAAEPFYTIGFGHYGPDVRAGQRITRSAAVALLHRDIMRRYAPPVLALKLPRQGMTDALVSLVYNCGPGILTHGTLGAALYRRDWPAVANAILLFDKDIAGRRLAGLSARRRAERALFLAR